MKRIFFLIALFFCWLNNIAQNLSVIAFAGFSNYQGDLQDRGYTLNQAHPAAGVGVLYQLSNHFNATVKFSFGTISGDDKYNSKNSSRNLSFTSPISDAGVGLEYCILNLNEKVITPFIFCGINYFHFNPSTKDTAGNKVYLQPLSTEGQGFYQGRKVYSLNQFSIPIGGGIKVALTNNVQLSFDIIFRKTFTDYLDDVSTTYIDKNILLANRSPLAVKMAFRTDEIIATSTYPPDGTQRGNSHLKDWYYFSGFSVIVKIPNNSNSSIGFKGKKGRTGCPTNVL